MTIDKQTAAEAVAKHGSLAKAAAALGCAKSSVWKAMNVGAVAASPRAPVAASLGGISLASARVSVDKPAEGLKRLIYGLKRGMGYPVEEVAAAWARSTDAVRKHARDQNAILYVEVAPGDWKLCVMHPDTAAEYRRKAGQ
jgi:hypothetical protein